MRRLRRILLRVLAVLAILLGAAWIAGAAWDRSLEARLERELDALRASAR